MRNDIKRDLLRIENKSNKASDKKARNQKTRIGMGKDKAQAVWGQARPSYNKRPPKFVKKRSPKLISNQ